MHANFEALPERSGGDTVAISLKITQLTISNMIPISNILYGVSILAFVALGLILFGVQFFSAFIIFSSGLCLNLLVMQSF